MSLLAKLPESKANIEEHDVVVTGIKPAGEMRWDKETKTHVARKEKSADTYVTFKTPDGKVHMMSCYKQDALPKGVYPQIGAEGLKATITLKENKDTTQPPNLIAVRFYFSELKGLQARMIELSEDTIE